MALLVMQVLLGVPQANDFKFFSGALAWPPGLLQEEINKGAW